jgi:acetolactate decarboxylase
MKVKLTLFAVILLLNSCDNTSTTSTPAEQTLSKSDDTFYHYSIWWAFVNKVFDGTLTAKELKTKGDIGLGSYNALDGELVMLDNVPYKVTEDGVVSVAKDDELIVYANAVHFTPEQSFTVDSTVHHQGLRDAINSQLKSKNVFYAFKIHGEFSAIKLGGLHKQQKPYDTGLDVLIPNRPVFEGENVTGTIVGFFCPEYIGNIGVANYHFHFISDDKKLGGHVMELTGKNLKVEVDPIHKYTFELPQTPDFINGKFDKEFQYNNK